MATTPNPYVWEGMLVAAGGVQTTGSTIHYFTGGDAQDFFIGINPNSGATNMCLRTHMLKIVDGHWNDASITKILLAKNKEYSKVNFDHPSNGVLYGVAIHDGKAYILRYEYAKDISSIVQTGSWVMQSDNAIAQLNLTLKNTGPEIYVGDDSLFLPGAKLIVSASMGDSHKLPIGVAYLDELDYSFASPTVALSARNSIGYMLNDQLNVDTPSFTTDNTEDFAVVLGWAGITNTVIESVHMQSNMYFEFTLNQSWEKCIQKMIDQLSDSDVAGGNWSYEEMPDGKVIVGRDAFRKNYMPRGHYTFDLQHDLFKRRLTRSIDSVYTKVKCTGTDAEGNELTPVIRNVTARPHWEPGENRAYIAQSLKGVTQSELTKYAKNLAKQLKYMGMTESYTGPFRPQVLVGDVADALDGNILTSLGIITEVTHYFGEQGFTTDFTVSSGGDSTDVSGGVYTSITSTDGIARKKRIIDFF